MKVKEAKADPSSKKFAFSVACKDGDVYRFDAETEGNLKEWLDAIDHSRVASEKLSEEWSQIKTGYAKDMASLRDRNLELEHELTEIRETGVWTANDALKRIQNKYEILEMSLGKLDEDLWLWIERNMWQTTTVQNLGFGSATGAAAVGGKPAPCKGQVSWVVGGEKGSTEVTTDHCYAATDNKEKMFTVNFSVPMGSEEVKAVVNVEDIKVEAPPSVPVASTTNEVKKLQRLMTLRNPSPPRSRQERRTAQNKSPRGKSPPKMRTLNLGTVSNQ